VIHILYKYYHSRKRRFDYFENKNKFRELVKDKIKHKYGLVGWLAGLWM
jgi:predicted glycosyltransferase involved in capsule biosynthesis